MSDDEDPTGSLARALADAWVTVTAAQTALAEAWVRLSPALRRRRMASLQFTVNVVMARAETSIRADLPDALAASAERGAVSAAADLASYGKFVDELVTAGSGVTTAVESVATSDLLVATEHVRASTKALIRRLVADHVKDKIEQGTPATTAARRLAKTFDEHGISAIVYRNGARHGLADYAAMVLRTKSAEAFQAGAHAQMRGEGIEWVELMDGPGCGLEGHAVGPPANGMIVALEVAERYPIAHPNCRRTSSPRPDVTSAAEAARAQRLGPQFTPAQDDAARADPGVTTTAQARQATVATLATPRTATGVLQHSASGLTPAEEAHRRTLTALAARVARRA